MGVVQIESRMIEISGGKIETLQIGEPPLLSPCQSKPESWSSPPVPVPPVPPEPVPSSFVPPGNLIASLFSVKITGRIAKRKRRLNFAIFLGFFSCFFNRVNLLNAITDPH